MISATSSIAAGILSSTFGTSAPANPSIPGTATASTSSQASLVQSLLGSGNSDAFFLSNVTYAQDTEALLQDPHSNGALTGTPSSFVQQIINALAPGGAKPAPTAAAPTTAATTSTTTTTTTIAGTDSSTPSLPPEGILA